MSLIFSYSFLDAFDSCPEKARNLFVTKAYKRAYLVEKDGGIDAHKELEKRIKERTPLPAALAKAESYVQSLERLGTVETEVPLAVDGMLRPTSFWGASGIGHQTQPMLRGKFDVIVRSADNRTAFLGDWKTGKVREKQDQLEIGALLLMAKHPEVDKVTAANIWLSQGQITTPPYVFTRTAFSAGWARWVGKMRAIERLDAKVEWPIRPSPLCGWCPVASCPEYRGG